MFLCFFALSHDIESRTPKCFGLAWKGLPKRVFSLQAQKTQVTCEGKDQRSPTHELFRVESKTVRAFFVSTTVVSECIGSLCALWRNDVESMKLLVKWSWFLHTARSAFVSPLWKRWVAIWIRAPLGSVFSLTCEWILGCQGSSEWQSASALPCMHCVGAVLCFKDKNFNAAKGVVWKFCARWLIRNLTLGRGDENNGYTTVCC